MKRKSRKCHGGIIEENYANCDYLDCDTGVCLLGGDDCEFDECSPDG